MNHTKLPFIFLVTLATFCTVTHGSIFYVNGTFYKEVNTPSIRIKDSINITGQIVLADPETACGLKDDTDIFGNILWISPNTGAKDCDLAKRIQKAEKFGAIGVIYGNNGYGGGHGFLAYYNVYGMREHKSSIPGVEVEWENNKDIRDLLKDKSNIVTVVMTDGSNDMDDAAGAWIAFSVIEGIHSVVCLAVVVHKWRLFVIHSGFQASVPQGCLMFHAVSCILRLLLVVDPPYARGIYPFQFIAFLDLLSYPLILCATLLMAFYWEEAMRVAKVHSIPTLQKMKIPFWISACLLLALAFLCIILRGTNSFLSLVTIINISIILLFSIPITIFYAVQAGKILTILFKSKKVNLGRKQTALYKMTLLLVGGSALMAAYVICIIALGATPYKVTSYITLRWLLYAIINFICLFQALAFVHPKGVSSTNSSDMKHASQSSVPTMNTIELKSNTEFNSVTAEETA